MHVTIIKEDYRFPSVTGFGNYKSGGLLLEVDVNYYHDFFDEESRNENDKACSMTELLLLIDFY
ncbi:hypothetical protein ABQE21_11505 [Enterococcus casseliflavus]|uniref:hypothetical protein n=1 Tax=Enterococcus casseliflavus TaxID=37734 RepID=UPI0032E47E5D